MARKTPYTAEEIVEQQCSRCGAPAKYQWNACADGNIWRPLCARCDLTVNEIVLKYLQPKTWRAKIKRYATKIGLTYPLD